MAQKNINGDLNVSGAIKQAGSALQIRMSVLDLSDVSPTEVELSPYGTFKYVPLTEEQYTDIKNGVYDAIKAKIEVHPWASTVKLAYRVVGESYSLGNITCEGVYRTIPMEYDEGSAIVFTDEKCAVPSNANGSSIPYGLFFKSESFSAKPASVVVGTKLYKHTFKCNNDAYGTYIDIVLTTSTKLDDLSMLNDALTDSISAHLRGYNTGNVLRHVSSGTSIDVYFLDGTTISSMDADVLETDTVTEL